MSPAPMDLAPDGTTLALMVSLDTRGLALQFLDTSTGKITREISLPGDVTRRMGYWIHSMRYLPNGRLLFAGGSNSVLLFDTQTKKFEVLGRHLTTYRPSLPGYFGRGGNACISALALSRDGCLVATACHEGRETIRIWNLTTCQQVHQLQHPAGDFVRGLAFSPDGTHLVSGVQWDEDGRGACCLWKLPPRAETDAQQYGY